VFVVGRIEDQFHLNSSVMGADGLPVSLMSLMENPQAPSFLIVIVSLKVSLAEFISAIKTLADK
jgi:hypothetical protein